MKYLLAILMYLSFDPALADGIEMQRIHVDINPDNKGLSLTIIPQHQDLIIRDIITPPSCTMEEINNDLSMVGVASQIEMRCSTPLKNNAKLTFPFLSSTVYVTYEDHGPLTPTSFMISNNSQEGFDIDLGIVEPRSFWQAIQEFLTLGIIHILFGWDHISFVFCLCFIALGKRLIYLVTAFTLGHSISMALAYLEIIQFPVPPIEAVIALSILFVAREAWMTQFRRHKMLYGTQPSMKGNLSVVTLFGLIHGLGFATILMELSISKTEQITGLVFFNIGVEIGQLLFIALVLAISFLIKNLVIWPTLLRASIIGVGSLGTFWTLERVAGF